MTQTPSPQQDPRTYLAVERTYLAWLRTGLALMGVGFAVARFGLFLREIQPSITHVPQRSSGMSVVVGVFLVGLGVFVNLFAIRQYMQLVRELRDGAWRPGQVSAVAVGFALLLAICGTGMAVYLVAFR